ncbi:filamentation induced by cAMP protein Fic (plasmid) [Solidesulfovibrio carbinoliphilus subsp. oakridgensis]|uniref:Filamentation induced by cAMP protein Fic n=1 Tax=Solidesulfovibrio carbinoliphilus subsp. oakridgensis TaxID=694327 RepID=G7QEA9_9BACT|nr:Fic family protein [Solidesulfovibrio carbinoliphilus]EHJ46003.1 filamentation induced by cAMP protein Fic [Solidesulfovibrio carbinoliphilus subsp. oakridgensis]
MPINPKEREKAIFIAKKNLASLVYDFQTLEGMPFTLPEVQTYLQGITVGGHKVEDEEKLKQQALAWKYLISLIEHNKFNFSKSVACDLQKIVAKDEALNPGEFRDGQVWIRGTGYVPPQHDGLDEKFEGLCLRIQRIKNNFEKGVIASLDMARNQYFYDGNKRTGLLMMNGIFISNGLMPFSVPSKSVLAYNTKMLDFYATGNEKTMFEFFEKEYAKEYPGFSVDMIGYTWKEK